MKDGAMRETLLLQKGGGTKGKGFWGWAREVRSWNHSKQNEKRKGLERSLTNLWRRWGIEGKHLRGSKKKKEKGEIWVLICWQRNKEKVGFPKTQRGREVSLVVGEKKGKSPTYRHSVSGERPAKNRPARRGKGGQGQQENKPRRWKKRGIKMPAPGKKKTIPQ